MYTYQDFVDNSQSEESKRQYVKKIIDAHKATNLFETALIAEEYDKHQNRTILQYRKMLTEMSGLEVPDNYSANYKLPSNFFNRFITQEVQFLLGNGVTWENEKTAKKLGADFDQRLQEAGKGALTGGVCFAFFNLDHIDVFKVTEFAPLYDENNGALMAGVRFWQIDPSKPLRATLYELDGYTEYLWNDDNPTGTTLAEKRKYKEIWRKTEADGTEIYDGENYPTFPIIPLWGNPHHQSELIGLREEIDAYDLIQSGFANDIDDASQIYWVVQNAGGMDDVDLARFLRHLKTVKAATVEDDGAKAEPHTIDVPYNAREIILTRLENTMYKDAMALNVDTIAGGAVTATQIQAAYEPLNSKTDQFETCVIDFIQKLLKIVGIEDNPTFTRSYLINVQENIQVLLQTAQFLPQDYITRKLLTYLGDGDKADEIIEQINEENYNRMQGEETEETDEGTGEETEDDGTQSYLDSLEAQMAELEAVLASIGEDNEDEDSEEE